MIIYAKDGLPSGGRQITEPKTVAMASATINNPLGIVGVSMTTSYAKMQLTDLILPILDPDNVFNVSYVSTKDTIIINKTGLYKFRAVFFLKGALNKTFFLKFYVDGVPVSAGDGIAIDLKGVAKPTPFPFSGVIYLVAGQEITFYGKTDPATVIDIAAGNWELELTPYQV